MDYYKSSSVHLFLFLLAFIATFDCSISARDLDRHHIHKSSQFLFPQQLLGSRKGHNIEGIHNIKTYLQSYGYLTKNYNIIDTNDAFDDHLESSIKKYQKFFKLNESGILDKETLHQMSLPRCAVPDIFENETSDLEIGSKYTFFPGNPKWPSWKYKLTYAFMKYFPEEYKESVRAAFTLWHGRSGFNFTEVKENERADVRISFEIGDHGDGHPFKMGSGVLAHTFGPGDARFHFNSFEPFAVGLGIDQYHVTTVALHEIGHALGLGHSTNGFAIMFPNIPPNFIKSLHPDDVNGLWDLYDGFDED